MNNDFYKNIKFLQEFDLMDQIPANVFTASVNQMPIHMHDGIELILVLEGTVSVKISFNNYDLSAGDFLLINVFEIHNIQKISETNKILFLQIKKEIFNGKLYAFDPHFYRCFNKEKVKLVKSQMLKIFSLCNEKPETNQNTLNYINRIADTCDSYFQMHKFDVKNKKVSNSNENILINERIDSTVKYIYFEFDKKIRLADLAEREHIDKCYASRLIKSGTGTTFQEYLNIVRVDRSEVLLLGTDEPISEISDRIGFSSYYYFINLFRQFFNMTPSEYRKKFRHDLYPLKQMKYDLVQLSKKEIAQYLNSIQNSDNNLKGNQVIVDEELFGKPAESIRPAWLIVAENEELPDSHDNGGPGDSPFASIYLLNLIWQERKPQSSYLKDIRKDGETKKEFIGATGLSTVHGVKKSTYYACSLLSQMGREVICQGKGYAVAKKDYSIQILLYPWLDNIFFVRNRRNDFFLESFDSEQSPFDISINISKEKNTKIKHYILDLRKDSFIQWCGMEAESELPPDEIELLNATSSPEVYFLSINGNAENSIHLKMSPFLIQLLDISFL